MSTLERAMVALEGRVELRRVGRLWRLFELALLVDTVRILSRTYIVINFNYSIIVFNQISAHYRDMADLNAISFQFMASFCSC